MIDCVLRCRCCTQLRLFFQCLVPLNSRVRLCVSGSWLASSIRCACVFYDEIHRVRQDISEHWMSATVSAFSTAYHALPADSSVLITTRFTGGSRAGGGRQSSHAPIPSLSMGVVPQPAKNCALPDGQCIIYSTHIRLLRCRITTSVVTRRVSNASAPRTP